VAISIEEPILQSAVEQVDGVNVDVDVDVDKNNNKQSTVEQRRRRARRRRRLRLLLLAVEVVIAVIIVVATVAVTKGWQGGDDDSDNGDASSLPTKGVREMSIERYVKRTVGKERFSINNNSESISPYQKALDWILFHDPRQLESPESISSRSNNLMQRYGAAYFYFATTTNGPWKNGCNPPSLPANETTGGDDGTTICFWSKLSDVRYMYYVDTISTAWLTNTSECTWAGVGCDGQGQVRSIDLRKSFVTVEPLQMVNMYYGTLWVPNSATTHLLADFLRVVISRSGTVGPVSRRYRRPLSVPSRDRLYVRDFARIDPVRAVPVEQRDGQN